jgi:type I restriction enzyme, S subunit
MSGRPRLGDFFSNRQEPGRPGLPVMSVTMNDSLVLRDDLDRRTESGLRPDQHLLVRKGDIAYNMMRMWQGACGLAGGDGMSARLTSSLLQSRGSIADSRINGSNRTG